jgi:hypothetical protein
MKNVTSDRTKEEEEKNYDGGESEHPGTFLSARKGIVRNYPIKFNVDDNTAVGTRCTGLSRQ